MASISVIIPSRVQENQVRFLERSIGSVQAQTIGRWMPIEVLVGIDPETEPPALGTFDVPVKFVTAPERSSSAAANAALQEASGNYVAILEDDDVWEATHLEISVRALEHGGFASGTQLEIDPQGTVVRINDFATPDSWVMHRSTWEQVGLFDTSYRYHADNEWLGRLAEQKIPRIHLVESTAPIAVHVARQVRPWLATLCDLAGGFVEFQRHNSPLPLVRRLVHPDSLMYQISADADTNSASDDEYQRIIERYGRIPW